MDILQILSKAHSGWRWILLVLLVAAIVKMHMGWKGKKSFTAGDKKLALFAMIAFHIQFLFGWILYFLSGKVQFGEGWMKNELFRFYGMEHMLMMTIAMVLITMGYSKSKKKDTDVAKFKVIAVFYTIAFVLILASIPWPFRAALLGSWM
jgi:hypothetical protein